MEPKENNRIEKILELISRFAESDFEAKGEASDSGDEPDLIISALNSLGEKLQLKSFYAIEQEKRINELVEVLLQYTMMDFSKKVSISEKGDELDAIGVGLNTLGEELESHIEQLKATNTELLEKSEQLLRSSKQMEQFAYIASHDLQEPLRTLSNYVGLFRKDHKGKLDANAEKYLDHISTATNRMQSLVRDLLEYARIGQNKNAVAIDCNYLLQEVLNDLAASVKETNAQIIFENLPVVNGYIELKSVFQNLISNAIKFRKSNTPTVIRVTVQSQINDWQFAVSDNGIGIEKKYYERIFSIFQKLHSQKQYAGTGIGLAQCKKIVELHGGRIWIESEPETGSTFYFTIPKIISQ